MCGGTWVAGSCLCPTSEALLATRSCPQFPSRPGVPLHLLHLSKHIPSQSTSSHADSTTWERIPCPRVTSTNTLQLKLLDTVKLTGWCFGPVRNQLCPPAPTPTPPQGSAGNRLQRCGCRCGCELIYAPFTQAPDVTGSSAHLSKRRGRGERPGAEAVAPSPLPASFS